MLSTLPRQGWSKLVRHLASVGLGVSLMGVAHAGGAQALQMTLEARLFRSGSGQFSANLLAPGAPELVNVVAAPDPSTAILVLVVVKLGPDQAVSSNSKVSLVVRENASRGRKGKTLPARTASLGPVARGATTHIPFWLQDTGCTPLTLTARIVLPGQSVPTPVVADVPFACSE